MLWLEAAHYFGFFAQPEFLHFTGRCFGQFEENNRLGYFEVCHLLATEIDNVLVGNFDGRVLKGNKSSRCFTPFIIRTGDDGSFKDIGMPIKRVLNFD